MKRPQQHRFKYKVGAKVVHWGRVYRVFMRGFDADSKSFIYILENSSGDRKIADADFVDKQYVRYPDVNED